MDELRALRCCGTCDHMFNTHREGKDTYECERWSEPLKSLFLVCKFYNVDLELFNYKTDLERMADDAIEDFDNRAAIQAGWDQL